MRTAPGWVLAVWTLGTVLAGGVPARAAPQVVGVPVAAAERGRWQGLVTVRCAGCLTAGPAAVAPAVPPGGAFTALTVVPGNRIGVGDPRA
ncbi:Cell division protein FtsK [Candidatus Hydrogenisulfobacillus filiaventi]|uniref:Cell division protein FtsK n=1 Tax=Candidatus Hydrogenisulfobacillus filiaventi TaxID=2707344 RepID=A0A6F8ZDW6_9FIRM|nr:Cell division protein FtsK [Candidatus Hydrogenisulfobacillus filiaventi]